MQMPFGSYINKIRVKRCPYCGIDRPRDYFIKNRSACWKCRAVKRDVKEGMRYDLIDEHDNQKAKPYRLG